MPQRMMERLVVKVWEFPVRAVHWTNFLCVVGLIFTGGYIHWPFLRTLDGPAPYLMGWMRLAHLILGWGLLVGLLARWYWSLVGNKFASTKEFFPFLYPARRRDMVGVFKYYAFTSLNL